MYSIPDFTPAENETVRQIVHEIYRETVEFYPADSEIMLNHGRRQLVDCPTLFWHSRDANFAVIRSGLNWYQCQFFYAPRDQYGTGREEYDSLEKCITTLLQVQADHERDYDPS